MTERETTSHDSSMSISTHFAILAHYSRMRQSHKIGQRQMEGTIYFE
jgi:hypothetical protein